MLIYDHQSTSFAIRSFVHGAARSPESPYPPLRSAEDFRFPTKLPCDKALRLLTRMPINCPVLAVQQIPLEPAS